MKTKNKKFFFLIYLIKLITNEQKGTEKSVYDFIVRHFLACCQKDAKGFETTISIEINNEKVLINQKSRLGTVRYWLFPWNEMISFQLLD